MPAPAGWMDKIKRFIWWYLIYPVFPYVRDFLIKIHLISHRGRQPYHLGWLRRGVHIRELEEYLHKQGFGNHFIAWVDQGQVLGLRKHDGFKYQYHLRVFRDGEICGHYEEAPEADPIEHFNEKVFEERKEQFRLWLGDYLAYQKS